MNSYKKVSLKSLCMKQKQQKQKNTENNRNEKKKTGIYGKDSTHTNTDMHACKRQVCIVINESVFLACGFKILRSVYFFQKTIFFPYTYLSRHCCLMFFWSEIIFGVINFVVVCFYTWLGRDIESRDHGYQLPALHITQQYRQNAEMKLTKERITSKNFL